MFKLCTHHVDFHSMGNGARVINASGASYQASGRIRPAPNAPIPPPHHAPDAMAQKSLGQGGCSGCDMQGWQQSTQSRHATHLLQRRIFWSYHQVGSQCLQSHRVEEGRELVCTPHGRTRSLMSLWCVALWFQKLCSMDFTAIAKPTRTFRLL